MPNLGGGSNRALGDGALDPKSDPLFNGLMFLLFTLFLFQQNLFPVIIQLELVVVATVIKQLCILHDTTCTFTITLYCYYKHVKYTD